MGVGTGILFERICLIAGTGLLLRAFLVHTVIKWIGVLYLWIALRVLVGLEFAT